MAYLILDPCGEYPRHFVEFLARTGRGGVAVFTSRARYALWRGKWSKILGDGILASYLAPGSPSVAALAAEIRQKFPRLEGVIPWDEETVLLGAELSEHLGLDWNPRRVIERCRDKAVMKQWLREKSSVRINASAVVDNAEDALGFQRSVGRWPIVVKPTAGSGSENVFFANSDDELLTSCQSVLLAGAGQVLLEEFIGGHELIVDGLVDRHSDLLVTDVWLYDRRDRPGRPNLFYQTLKVSTHQKVFHAVTAYAAAVVEALELRRAPIHMEVKVDDRGPCLIEVGARLSGGNVPLLVSKLHGRSIFELAACHYLADLPLTGGDLDYARYDRLSARILHGIQDVELPRIRAVHGADAVRKLQSFERFGVLKPVGIRLPQSRDLDTASWEVHLLHENPDQLELDCRRVREWVRYE